MIALRIGLLLALSLAIGYAAEAPIPCNDGKGECVKLHLCQDGTINTDGSNLIDIRFNDEDPCEHYLLKCCAIDDLGEEIVEPPNSEIIDVPLPSDENQHKGSEHNGGNIGQEGNREPEGNNGHGVNDGGNKGSGSGQGNYYGGYQTGVGGGSSNTHSSSSSNENSAHNCKLVCGLDHQNSGATGGVKGTGLNSGDTLFNGGGTSSSGGLVTEGQHAGSASGTALHNVGGAHSAGQVGTSNTAGGMSSESNNVAASQHVGKGGSPGTGSTGGAGFVGGSGSLEHGGSFNSVNGGSSGSHHTGQIGGSGSTSGSNFANGNALQNENQFQGLQGGTTNTEGGKSTVSQHVEQGGGTGTGTTGSTGFVSGSGSQEQGGTSNSISGGSTGSQHTGQTGGFGSTSASNSENGNELQGAHQGSHGGTTNHSGGKYTGSNNSGQTGGTDTGSVGGATFVSGSVSQGSQHSSQTGGFGSTDTFGSSTNSGGFSGSQHSSQTGGSGSTDTSGTSINSGGFTGSQHSSQTGGLGSTETFGTSTNSVSGGQREVQGGAIGSTGNTYSGQQSGTHSSSAGSTGTTEQAQQFATSGGTTSSSQKYTSDIKGSGTQSVVQGTGPAAGYSEVSGNVAQGTNIITKDQVKQQHTVTQQTHTSEYSHYQGSQHSGFYNQHSSQYDKYTDRGVKGENIRENVQGTTVGPMTNPENVGCGVRNADGVGFRITGNSDGESEYGEFPWMVAILKEEKALDQVINVYQCGGSLIHPAVVLTAAHCVQNKQPQDFKIRLGEWDTQTTNEIHDHQDRNVVEIVYHEKFYKGGLFNDIALLFLDKPAEVIETVNTVCLPPQDFNFDMKRCFASGWGKDVFGKEGKYQVILKKIELPVMPYNACQKAMRTTRLGARFVLNKSFMCAGGEKGKDTCKGDGGSPLVCPIPGSPNRYYQAGIVAWGIGCGENGIPGVYANVAGFRKWIDDHLTQRSITHDYYIYV